MADNVIPINAKKRFVASLRPAGLTSAQAAVAVLAKALPIMPSIQDPPAFKQIMADRLAPYPRDVLLAAVDQAIVEFDEMPSIKAMLGICEGLIEPRRAGLRAIQRAEDERRARELDAANRQREAADRAAAERSWCVDLQARLAMAGDAPSVDDVELATGLKKSLLRAGMPLTWGQFAAADCRAAADLCKRLAEIARSGKRPDQGAIVGALTDAGLEAPPAPSAEGEMRSLGAVLRDVITKTNEGPRNDRPD